MSVVSENAAVCPTVLTLCFPEQRRKLYHGLYHGEICMWRRRKKFFIPSPWIGASIIVPSGAIGGTRTLRFFVPSIMPSALQLRQGKAITSGAAALTAAKTQERLHEQCRPLTASSGERITSIFRASSRSPFGIPLPVKFRQPSGTLRGGNRSHRRGAGKFSPSVHSPGPD
jgi:hypothetical protein